MFNQKVLASIVWAVLALAVFPAASVGGGREENRGMSHIRP